MFNATVKSYVVLLQMSRFQMRGGVGDALTPVLQHCYMTFLAICSIPNSYWFQVNMQMLRGHYLYTHWLFLQERADKILLAMAMPGILPYTGDSFVHQCYVRSYTGRVFQRGLEHSRFHGHCSHNLRNQTKNIYMY